MTSTSRRASVRPASAVGFLGGLIAVHSDLVKPEASPPDSNLRTLDVLASFLPRERLTWIVGPGPLLRPRSDRVPGVVLFVDVSGFTRLTERLSRLGARGSEELSRIVDACFGRMTQRVTELGGDVIAYAGDAMLAMWPVDSERELGAAVCLAAQAGLQAHSDQSEDDEDDGTTERLQLRASVACGSLVLQEVGGSGGRWQYLVGGEPLAEVFEADDRAEPGDVVLAPSASRRLGHRGSGTTLPGEFLRLQAVADPVATRPPARLSIPPDRADVIRACAPGFIVARLEADHRDWLAEFRTISVVFISLGEAAGSATGPAAGLQEAFAAMQSAVEDVDGFVYQALVDDKGVSLLAAFGLPSQAYENDAARAVGCAMGAHRALLDLGRANSIGVTTGLAFTGIYGSDSRRQYTLVGSVMNRGARLAQAADGGVLCDAATRAASARRGGIGFVECPPLELKGIERPVPVWRPIAGTARTSATDAAATAGPAVVGRTTERGILDDSVEAIIAGLGGRLILLEGEAGIGKSRLASYAVRRAVESGARGLAGEGRQIGQQALFHAWRPVFEALLQIDSDESDRESLQATLHRRCAGIADFVELAPLLSAVLPFDLPETRRTAAMPAEARAEATRGLLAELLRFESESHPTVLLMEDVHWLDSASLSLLAKVVENASDLLVIATTRPSESEVPPLRRTLNEAAGPRRLILGAMDEAETSALIGACLAVDDVPGEIASAIHRRAQGNPFFTEQLALAMRDYGIIVTGDGSCALTQDVIDLNRFLDEELSRRGLPGTLQGVISSRIDRLGPEQQLTVKLASVIGSPFEIEALASVYPDRIDTGELKRWLDELVRLKIAIPEDSTGDGSFAFRHAILRDVVYNSLTFGQRAATHTSVAEWIEGGDGASEVRNFPVLAHHWARAGAHGKARGYLGRAGDDALERYANEEAVRFFEEALAIDETAAAGSPAPEDVKASWELQLGAAYVNWSRYQDAKKHLGAGLVLKGHRAPGSSWFDGVDLMGQIARQVVHRLWADRFVGMRRTSSSELRRVARAYESLVEAFYLENATLPCLLSAVRSLNLAELGGPSAELARGYASFGAILGFVPAHGLADGYFERALRTAQEADDTSALAWVRLAAGVYKIGVGDWDEAAEHLGATRKVSERLGDRRRWDDAMQNLAALEFLRGRYAPSRALAGELLASAADRKDERGLSVAVRRRALCLLATNELSELAPCIDELGRYTEGTDDLYRDLPPLALSAQLELRLGHYREAFDAASAALAIMRASTPTFHDSLSDFVNTTQVLVSLQRLSAEGEVSEMPELDSRSREACKALGRYARVFPIGRPYARLCSGIRWHARKRHRRAAAEWRESVAAAGQFGMEHCEALARLELGSLLQEDRDGGYEHLTRAAAIFERLGTEYEHSRARMMLHDV